MQNNFAGCCSCWASGLLLCWASTSCSSSSRSTVLLQASYFVFLASIWLPKALSLTFWRCFKRSIRRTERRCCWEPVCWPKDPIFLVREAGRVSFCCSFCLQVLKRSRLAQSAEKAVAYYFIRDSSVGFYQSLVLRKLVLQFFLTRLSASKFALCTCIPCRNLQPNRFYKRILPTGLALS